MSYADVYLWKHEDVVKLIGIRISKDSNFGGKRGTAKQQWTKIADSLECGATGEQCKKKWQNLIAKYKNIIIPPTGDGLEEEGHEADHWPYFDVLNEYMSDRHVIHPVLLINSSASTSAQPETTENSLRSRKRAPGVLNAADTSKDAVLDMSDDDDDRNAVVIKNKKRRTDDTNRETATANLLHRLMRQLEETQLQQEEARKNDVLMGQILKKFLEKK